MYTPIKVCSEAYVFRPFIDLSRLEPANLGSRGEHVTLRPTTGSLQMMYRYICTMLLLWSASTALICVTCLSAYWLFFIEIQGMKYPINQRLFCNQSINQSIEVMGLRLIRRCAVPLPLLLPAWMADSAGSQPEAVCPAGSMCQGRICQSEDFEF